MIVVTGANGKLGRKVVEELLKRVQTAIDSAKKAGVSRLLYTSQMFSAATSHLPPMNVHAATEEMLKSSGMAFTSLRNGFYAASAIILTEQTYDGITPHLTASEAIDMDRIASIASKVLDRPIRRPRNIIGGHFLTTLCGLLVHQLGVSGVWGLSLGVGLGIAAMLMTKTTHPPAGANPIVVITC